MPKLEPPDNHYVSAAMGWIELGNSQEALAELGRISEAGRRNPDVLEVFWAIHAGGGDWVAGLATARALLESDPRRSSGWLNQAYALRRISGGGLQAAWDALLPAAEKFPDEPIIAFNLACYACQMQHLDEARNWLGVALKSGARDRIKSMALRDPDLEPLWEEIRRM